VFVVTVTGTASGEIEAVKGKHYSLTKKHGPWMIMVAAIRDVDDDKRFDRRIEGGMTAREAADEMVYALRKKGIPAYIYALDEKVEHIASPNLSESNGRRYIAQQGYISVMAGNFPSNSDKSAKSVLEYIKNKFNPEFLADAKNGGILPRTPGRPSPFSRAFLTVNPLWQGEVRDVEEDKLIADLNAGYKYSLLENKGKYTVVVATFQGGSVVQVGNNSSTKATGFFDRTFGKNLNDFGEDAMQLTEKLRNAKKFGYDTNYEAWVYHDKYKSIVTIGSFDSQDDPRIRAVATQFGGKTVRHPQSGEDVVAGEAFTIPRYPKNGQAPEYSWVLDAQTRLIDVPHIP
jgi:hypothetical protein